MQSRIDVSDTACKGDMCLAHNSSCFPLETSKFKAEQQEGGIVRYQRGHGGDVEVQFPGEGYQKVSILPSRFLHPIQVLFIAHIHQNHLDNFLHFRNKVAPFSLNRMASTFKKTKMNSLHCSKEPFPSRILMDTICPFFSVEQKVYISLSNHSV